MARLTPGELRTNAEKIADDIVKRRVLAGIEVLNREYGPDWVDKIDPATLCLSSTSHCVLGQVYADAVIPAGRDLPTPDGYWRALALIDGDIERNPELYGFAAADDDYDDYDEEYRDGDAITYEMLTDAWRTVLR